MHVKVHIVNNRKLEYIQFQDGAFTISAPYRVKDVIKAIEFYEAQHELDLDLEADNGI